MSALDLETLWIEPSGQECAWNTELSSQLRDASQRSRLEQTPPCRDLARANLASPSKPNTTAHAGDSDAEKHQVRLEAKDAHHKEVTWYTGHEIETLQ